MNIPRCIRLSDDSWDTFVPDVSSRLSEFPNSPMEFSISFYVTEPFHNWRLVPIKRLSRLIGVPISSEFRSVRSVRPHRAPTFSGPPQIDINYMYLFF